MSRCNTKQFERIWIDREGYLTPPEGPGLGVTVNEEAIARYKV